MADKQQHYNQVSHQGAICSNVLDSSVTALKHRTGTGAEDYCCTQMLSESIVTACRLLHSPFTKLHIQRVSWPSPSSTLKVVLAEMAAAWGVDGV